MVSGERIAAGTILWAAGVVASPAAAWLGVEPDRAGRIKVGPDLSVPGLSDVFAIGDTALALAWNGQPAPGLAPQRSRGAPTLPRCCGRGCGIETAPAVSLPAPGQFGHHWTQERGRGFRAVHANRRGGVVALGRRACPVPDQLAQSALGNAQLGLVLFHVRRRSASDYGKWDPPRPRWRRACLPIRLIDTSRALSNSTQREQTWAQMATTVSLVCRRPLLPITMNEHPLVAVAHSNAAVLDWPTPVICTVRGRASEKGRLRATARPPH